MPKEDSQYICLPVILTDSVFRACKNYYPQVVFEKYKYFVEEKKIPRYIINNIEISSDSDRENSDKENSNEKNSDKEN